MLIVHGKHTSENIAFGLGVSSSNNFSAGCCSRAVAKKNLSAEPIAGSMSRFSHPSGNPASSDGNLSWTNRIWSPDCMARVTTVRKRAALCGVVTMVMVMPLCANSLAKSIIGIMWPWAMKGNKTKWSWRSSSREAMETKIVALWSRLSYLGDITRLLLADNGEFSGDVRAYICICSLSKERRIHGSEFRVLFSHFHITFNLFASPLFSLSCRTFHLAAFPTDIYRIEVDISKQRKLQAFMDYKNCECGGSSFSVCNIILTFKQKLHTFYIYRRKGELPLQHS